MLLYFLSKCFFFRPPRKCGHSYVGHRYDSRISSKHQTCRRIPGEINGKRNETRNDNDMPPWIVHVNYDKGYKDGENGHRRRSLLAFFFFIYIDNPSAAAGILLRRFNPQNLTIVSKRLTSINVTTDDNLKRCVRTLCQWTRCSKFLHDLDQWIISILVGLRVRIRWNNW